MDTLTWTKECYLINGEPQYLLSGEFHYFRVPKKDWKQRLIYLKEAGAGCVATYIPWILHEPVEGDIRFGDVDYRDLEGFLRICKEVGLLVMCRPGPYQYSELKNAGLPGWLSKDYPEIMARDIDGKILNTTSVSYLHPRFLEKTKNWFDVVCPIIAKYLVSKGGPVVFVQLDNELMSIHLYTGHCDFSREGMGIGAENGYFVKYLTGKYNRIESLNTAYGTDFSNFLEVGPFLQTDPDSKLELTRSKDYWEFYFWAGAQYLLKLKQMVRENGIDCDVIHNAGGPEMNTYFRETTKELGDDFLFGSDNYYNLDMHWQQNNPTPQYALKAFYSSEIIRLMGYPSTIFELASGSLSDWPPFMPDDATCCYLTNIAFGVKGINYYIFTGGKNPEQTGSTGDIYDYNAPVSHTGELRPLYFKQKELGAFLNKNGWLSKSKRESDFLIGVIWDYPRSNGYLKKNSLFELTGSDAWTLAVEGITATALCASYSPGYIDLYDQSFISNTSKPLFIASASYLPAIVQQNIVRFIENGGNLVICPTMPTMDESYAKCNILNSFLGGSGYRKLDKTSFRLTVGPIENIYVNDQLFICETPPDGAEIIAREEDTNSIAGWKKTYGDGGSAIWIGLKWHCAKFEHFDMMRYLLKEINVPGQVVVCDNPNVWTSLFCGENKNILFIMNLFSSPMSAGIRVETRDTHHDTGIHTLAPMEVKIIHL